MDQAVGASGLKHVKIREHVRSLVENAAPGSPAPSERELVRHFGVARMTVRQAVDALVAEGLLERIPGRGTFVATPRSRAGRLLSHTEELGIRGLTGQSQTLVAREERAGPGVAKALAISEGDLVVHWRRVRRAENVPLAVEDAYLNAALVPGLVQPVMPASLYAALAERGLRPSWAEDSVKADAATAEEARLLEVGVGSPVLRVSRRGVAGETPVHVSRSTYRGDRYTFWVRLADQ